MAEERNELELSLYSELKPIKEDEVESYEAVIL